MLTFKDQFFLRHPSCFMSSKPPFGICWRPHCQTHRSLLLASPPTHPPHHHPPTPSPPTPLPLPCPTTTFLPTVVSTPCFSTFWSSPILQSFDSLSCDLKSHLMVGPNISGFLLSAKRLSPTASNRVSFSFSA